MTREEKLQDIKEAVEMYKKANELVEKANKLIQRNIRGFRLIGSMPIMVEDWDYPQYRGKLNVHVHSGISKLEKVLDVKAEAERDYDGSKKSDRKALVVDGIKFFQIGEATQSKYCYR